MEYNKNKVSLKIISIDHLWSLAVKYLARVFVFQPRPQN
jgi:hypothetical protein